MLAKAVFVVIGIGAMSATLLALRQQRLQAAHELARTQIRVERQDEELWKVRARIAGLVNPQNVALMAGEMTELHALVADGPEEGVPPLVQSGTVGVSLTPPPPKRYVPPAKRDRKQTSAAVKPTARPSTTPVSKPTTKPSTGRSEGAGR